MVVITIDNYLLFLVIFLFIIPDGLKILYCFGTPAARTKRFCCRLPMDLFF